jgi:hypothetical protein
MTVSNAAVFEVATTCCPCLVLQLKLGFYSPYLRKALKMGFLWLADMSYRSITNMLFMAHQEF